MVIVSSGALSTPQILQRSGIGDAEKLRSLDIEVVSDLPGVGQNYQDHQMVSKSANLVEAIPDSTVSDVFRNDGESIIQLVQSNLARNFIDTGIKLRPTEDEVRTMGPEFQQLWDDYFVNKPDKPLIYIGIFTSYIFNIIFC